MHKKTYKLGFSTLEILVAMAIATISITAAVSVSFGSQKLVIDSQSSTEALGLAQVMIQQTQIQAAGDFESIKSLSVITENGYQKALEVKEINSYTNQVTAIVSWKSSTGQDQNVELSTLLTDYNNTLGNTCQSPLPGDWQNPQMGVFEFGKDLVGDVSGTNPISDIRANRDKLYISLVTASTKTAPTFFIFDVSGTATPTLISSIDNATSTTAGISSFVVKGNYAYIASARAISSLSGFGQLQIIDISNSNAPKLITSFKIPGVTGTSGQGIGSSIFYKNGFVYIGLTKTGSGPEFNIIDVSDVLNSKLVGSFTVGNSINAILVKDNFAYLAHPTDSTSLPAEQLTVLDVSDPANPKRIGGFHAPDNQGNGKSLAWENGKLYLGRTVTATVNPELYILDGTTVVDSKKISSSVNSLMVNNGVIFDVTNTQFQIWNGAASLSLPGGAGTAITCTGKTVYAASASASGEGYIFVVVGGG